MPDETILIIDDSADFVKTLISYIIEPMGYRAIHAFNGKKGLDMAQKYGPDLILLDMNMPRMSGLETLTALRQTECRAPVIFMTMHGSESIAVKAFKLGVRDYLTKPFSASDLQRAVDAALQETRLGREKEELSKNLLISETIRQTVVTLSHYINNNLMILTSSLELLEDMVPRDAVNATQIIRDSKKSTRKIEAVLRVLQKVTNPKLTTYYGQITMVDIEKALAEELASDKR